MLVPLRPEPTTKEILRVPDMCRRVRDGPLTTVTVMLVSDAHRMVFVHVQKTGGVTVGQVLEEAIPDVRRWPAKGVKHATLAQALEAEPALGDYWSFAIVRNPWSRLVSWWAMVQRFKGLAADGVEHAQARFDNNAFLRTARDYPDFETFVVTGSQELGRLRIPQVDYVTTASGRTCDFIGRTESLRADVEHVFDHLGLPFPGELPHRNRSAHGHYRDYYSDRTRDLVGELFAPDIAAFGYSF